MKIENGKVIINKKDLNRKVVLIRNHNSEVELQAAQFAVGQSSPGSIAIPESSFKKYNDFRYDNKHDRLTLNQVMIVDVRKAEQDDNFEKFKDTNLKKEK